MMINTDSNIIDTFLKRHINEAIPGLDQLKHSLLSGKKLRIYQGFDPTSPYLHVGHLVGIITLRKLQQLGHEIIFLIGDFTATIGDPTGKDKTRIPLTIDQVRTNAQSYQNQIKNILDFEGENKAIIRYNSEWLAPMQMEEILTLAMNFTAQQMLERDMFQKRLGEGKPISLHEFLYPILVTKDALALDVDIELGGSDQLFNMSVGRHVIKSISGKDKFAITTKLLTDTAGNKIGKSEGNAINLTNTPENLYGQIMSLPDESILNCFQLITLVPDTELAENEDRVKTNPMLAKKQLAYEIVQMLHSQDTANLAQAHFEKTVQGNELPEQISEFALENLPPNQKLFELLVSLSLASSNSDAKRLIDQHAVKLNQQTLTDPNLEIQVKSDDIIQVGKRNFIKLK